MRLDSTKQQYGLWDFIRNLYLGLTTNCSASLSQPVTPGTENRCAAAEYVKTLEICYTLPLNSGLSSWPGIKRACHYYKCQPEG